MILADYLAQALKTRFVWGQRDCWLYVADWVLDQTGLDPASSVRGRYDSEETANAILERAGGYVAFVSAQMALCGLPEVTEPAAGDVGLIDILTRKGRAPAAAICTGPKWSVLSEGGLLTIPARPLVAWSL